MPMRVWIANKGGLHGQVNARSLSTPPAELRRELPPELATLPDVLIPDVWGAWVLLCDHGHTLDEVTDWFELGPELRAALARAFEAASEKPKRGRFE